jgi:membrane protease subunit HflC
LYNIKRSDIMRRYVKWLYALLLAVLVGAFGFTHVVREGTCAIVSRFGAIRTVRMAAGLGFKLPWPFEQVVSLDLRGQYLDSGYTETLTQDKKNVILQTYAVWSIEDPERFYTSVGSMPLAEQYLNDLLTNAKNGVLGGYDLSSLVSSDAENLRLDEIEDGILVGAQTKARENYGVALRMVKIKRLALPTANVETVFEQMSADRQKAVTQLLSEGERDAAILRSQADVDAARIIADAQNEAAAIDAQTEQESASIYAEAYARNPELFVLLNQLSALENSVNDNSVLVVDAQESPFRILLKSLDPIESAVAPDIPKTEDGMVVE